MMYSGVEFRCYCCISCCRGKSSIMWTLKASSLPKSNSWVLELLRHRLSLMRWVKWWAWPQRVRQSRPRKLSATLRICPTRYVVTVLSEALSNYLILSCLFYFFLYPPSAPSFQLYLNLWFLQVKKVGKVVRAICFMSHPIPNTNDSDSIQIILPQKQLGRRSDM